MRNPASRLAAAYCAALVALSTLHFAAPQRDGPLALSQVFAPHLFLPLAVVLLLALRRNAEPSLRILLAVALVIGTARFGGGIVSLPAAAPDQAEVVVRLLSWNLAAGEVGAQRLIDRLRTSDAEIVGLQELRPIHAAALEADASLLERYPYRVVEPHREVRGMALLSAHPIVTSSFSFEPPHIEATIALPGDRALRTVTAHPLPPRMALIGMLPRRFDTAQRDADLRTLRALLDPALEAGEAVLMFGDFNITDRESGYHELSRGLSDAHLAVGWGVGSTWRPPPLSGLPLGILRIDYIFAGGPARPLWLIPDCSAGNGDHCLLEGAVAVGGAPP